MFMARCMINVEPIAKTRSEWGEGPVWWDGALFYVDIAGHKVHRYCPATGEEQSWNVGQRVGFIVPRASGGFVIGGDHGLYFMAEDGGLTPIVDPEPEKADNRFNDGKCAPDGRLLAGTISLVKKKGDAQLYQLSADGELNVAFSSVTNSNGLAWSGDGKTLFYIDTPRCEILGFDYTAGQLTNVRTVVDTGYIAASPDGMEIDEDDNLWVAFCHGACVVCFDARTGNELQRVNLPCLETTSCAFGGENLDELYVTTGVHGSVKEELAGSLFKITGLGVKGRRANAFAG